VPLRDMPRITREAFPALMLPVILLGCLYSGITTPTEAAGVAAAYALLISAACTAACAGATSTTRCCRARA
jgi:C4-dicarboxylate transporter DctM subunit